MEGLILNEYLKKKETIYGRRINSSALGQDPTVEKKFIEIP